MKLIFKPLIAILIVLFTSCEDKIDEINVNPDSFTTAPDAQILTGAIAYYAYVVEVDLNANSFLWAQYYTWGPGVAIGNEERFVQNPNDGDPYWNRAYAAVLKDLDYLIKKSTSPVYRGVAKILSAHVYQGLVDHFGDIPYTQALQGEVENLSPEYDDAADVYAALIVQIDDGLAEFDLAREIGPDEVEIISGNNADGANDLLYQGDLDAWTKFANSLKLRILMRQSESATPQGTAIVDLIASGAQFIETEADMPQILTSSNIGNQNPMYARFESGVQNFYILSNATANVLEDLSDPRLTALYRPAAAGPFVGQYHGIDQGTIDAEPFTNARNYYAQMSAIAYAVDNPVILMSHWEVWFLRAEAAARYATADDEEVAFSTAVQAHFDYVGAAGGAAYITSLAYSDSDPLDTRIDAIAVQKWISMNGLQEDEGWIETRRFDRTSSRLFTEGIFQEPTLSQLPDGEFPSVWLIPATERNLNSNAPAQRVITDKIFWDN